MGLGFELSKHTNTARISGGVTPKDWDVAGHCGQAARVKKGYSLQRICVEKDEIPFISYEIILNP